MIREAITLGLVVIGIVVMLLATPDPSKRLAGYGCPGTTEVLYADEEDQFPEGCDRIVPAEGGR